ncbi:ester cyclase [Rubrivirga litoralis]|uniref:Ester cyclase n=1 Tax=Rubrivirga litoralis TaxID=3075598 RepID=A0ABU3BQB1_9BACT|nr:ester cyclase [Rubrivirga sp. F394]MDT0631458.1 ester cyclase [Rubrivirga sp. F394]
MDAKQKNIDAQKRWGEEVASNGKLDVLDDILADDFVDHDPGDYAPTREGVKQFFRDFRTAFPDLKAEVVEMTATDEYVTLRYTVSGTHRGEFMGHAPTGRSFEAPSMQLGRWRDGRCVERWGVTDQSKILEQLGLIDV